MNVDALRSSWAQVTTLGDAAAKHFYATLFLLAPDTRKLFPHSMSAQNDKLLAALGHIVSNVDNPEIMGAFAAQLGADHRRFAVQAHHYAVVGQALLSTLASLLGRAWTPELGQDWEKAYRAVAELMIDGAAAASAQPAVWYAKVGELSRPTADIIVFTLHPDYPLDYRPGQSLPVRSARMRRWRYLSPANAPRPDCTIDFHVRAVGADSAALVSHLAPGEELQLGAPVGDTLTLDGTSGREVVMIAGSTGVAPMCALIEGTLEREPRPTTLVFGAQTPAGLYHHTSLRRLADQHPWLTYVPTVETGLRWNGPIGTAAETAIATTPCRRADVLVCGSPQMVDVTTRSLCRNGVDPSRIITERLSNMDYPPLQRSPKGMSS